MKTIGLVGGMSPQSTLKYYEYINQRVNQRLKKNHSAKLLIVSVDFETITSSIFEDDWGAVKQIVLKACQVLERAPVDFIAFCSNTIYKVASGISAQLRTPLIHILDPVVKMIQLENYQKVGLLGTDYTMSGLFHRAYLCSRSPGLECLVPGEQMRSAVNRVIFEDLCFGRVSNATLAVFEAAVFELKAAGSEAIILGCTELQMAFSKLTVDLPLLDTTTLHADYLVNLACSNVYAYLPRLSETEKSESVVELEHVS